MTKPISDNQKQFFEKHGWKTEGVTCGEAFRKMEEFFTRMKQQRNIDQWLDHKAKVAHDRDQLQRK